MNSSWKKQRLATKKKQIKQIRYKKSVFKQFNVDITPFERFTSQQISIGFKNFLMKFQSKYKNILKNLKKFMR
jgi:hypothetical protein